MTAVSPRPALLSAVILTPFLLLGPTSPSTPASGQELLPRTTAAQLAVASDALLVQLAPRPKDLVRITEGSPYVVPRGRVLVVKAFGATGFNRSAVTLLVDGVPALSVDLFSSFQGIDLATGLAVQAGETVTLESGFPDPTSLAVALGYLGND